MSDSSSILKSKFFIPQPTKDFVERRSLIAKFEKLETCPVMLVSASSGYGKSTLVANFLSQLDEKNAWLSLSEKENEFTVFITYFITAIQIKAPSFGKEALKLMKTSGVDQSDEIAELLINDLADLGRSFYLAIDDYQHVKSEFTHQFLATLFEYPQPYFKLILITRHDPELPLPEWISKNMLVEIRSSDLTFSKDEIAEFYEKTLSYRPGESILSKLEQATEGWVSGLRMLNFTTVGIDDLKEQVASFRYKNSKVLGQLVHAVLDSQTDSIRNKLLRLSLVKKFNLELFAELCLTGDECKNRGVLFNEFVATITRSNMFFITVDDDQIWYSFQNLFVEYLYKTLLDEYTEEEVNELRILAADWFAGNQMHEDAIQLYMEANQDQKALRIFATYRLKLITEDRLQFSAKVLKFFPRDLINKNGILRITWGWVLLKEGKISQMAEHIEPLEQALSQEAYPTDLHDALLGEVHAMKALDGYLSNGAMQACFEHSKTAIKFLKDKNPFALGLAWVFYGASLQHMGQSSKARKDLYQELEICTNDIIRGQILIIISCLDWFDGDLTTMQQSALHLLQLGRDTGFMQLLANGNILLGISYYYQNQDEKALVYLEAAHEIRDFTLQYMSFPAGMALADIYAKSGRMAEKEILIQTYQETASQQGNTLFSKISRSASASIACRYQNDLSGLTWAKKNACCEFLPFSYLYSTELAQAYVLTMDDDPQSHRLAKKVLNRTITFYEDRNDANVLIRAFVIQSVLYYKLGHTEEAIGILTKALELSSLGHFIRPYVELGHPMLELLQEDLRTKRNQFHIDEILKHINLKANPNGKVNLTVREKEILFLSEHMTIKELADRLFISDKTVKTHITNIYKKLEVSNKKEALQKASDLKII